MWYSTILSILFLAAIAWMATAISLVGALPVGSILFLAAIACFVYKRKRMMALQGVAPSLGFSYQREASLDDIDVFSLNFDLFRKGDSKRIKNVISGQRDGVDIRIFEYRYNRGTIKFYQTQTVLLLQSYKLDLPKFELRPKGIHHKIGSLLGQQGINLEPHPDFSAMYLLQGDEKAIRELFTHDIVSYFAHSHDICAVGWSNTLLVYREGKCVSPHRLAAFLEEGLGIFQLFTAP
jgi:hypothetical protein